MEFLIIIILAHGIPITIVILFIYFVIKNIGYETLSRKLRNFLFIGLGIYILGFSAYNWWLGQHFVTFKIKDKYEFNLSASEIESFLDWPIDFNLEVLNSKTNEKLDFDFTTGWGPYLIISISDNNDGLIEIKGYDRNSGHLWLIDLNKNTISNNYLLEEKKEGFREVAKLTNDFKIIKIDQKP